MIPGKSARNMFLALVAVCLFQQGCGSGNFGDSGAAAHGTVNLEGLKVGVPESILKDAVLTFVLNEDVAAKSDGRNCYISRSKDSKGGQFIAQCKNGDCFRLEANYIEPITKEQAMETLKKMLPTGASEPAINEKKSRLSNDLSPTERYDCGDNYVGELQLVDGSSDKVKLVAAVDRTKVGPASKGGAAPAPDAKASEAPATETKSQ